MADCIGLLRKKFKGASKEEIENFVRDAEGVREGSMSLEDFINKSKMDIDEFTVGELYYKKTQIDNLVKLDSKKSMFAEKSNYEFKPKKGLMAILRGDNEVATGSLDSVARDQATSVSQWSQAIDEIHEKGLWNIFESGKMDKDIRIERFEMHREGGKPGVTGNKIAQEIARIIKQVDLDRAYEQNQAGAFTRIRDDYAGLQNWDAARVRKAPFEEFKQYMSERFGTKETYKGVKNRDQFWKDVYEDIAGDEPFSRVSPSNVASSLSGTRKLHAVNGTALAEAMEKFGTDSVAAEVKNSIAHSASRVGLLRHLGTQPEETMKTLIKDLKSKYTKMLSHEDPKIRSKAEKALNEVNKAEPAIMNNLKIREGSMFRGSGVERGIGLAAEGLRTVEFLSKTGGSLLSQFGDPVNAAALISSSTGKSFVDTQVKIVSTYAKMMSPELRRSWAKHIGIGLDAQIADMRGPILDAGDSLSGLNSKINKSWFWLNGMSSHSARVKMSAITVLAQELGDQAGKGFDQLSPELKHRFGAHNITSKEWDLIRASVKEQEVGDWGSTRFISPAEMARGEARRKILGYLDDIGELATSMPQARERAMMYGRYGADTYLGTTLRLLTQLQGPLWTMPKIARQIYSSRPKGNMSALGAWGVGVLAASTASEYLRSIVYDREFDITSTKTIGGIFGRSGLGGVFYDHLASEFQRGKRGAPGAAMAGGLLGPVGGDITQAIGLAAGSKTLGGEGTRSHGVIDFGTRMIPGQNLIWKQIIMQNSLSDQMHEYNEPGWKQKQELKKMQRDLEKKGF